MTAALRSLTAPQVSRSPARSWAVAFVVLPILAAWPIAAAAGPADESRALSVKGAALFKKADYFGAAEAFERAYALDAADFRVLRYAGRAWQEIGHIDRALTLLERYYALETEANLRASVMPNLDKLRKATPREKAESLDAATRKYPQARLEETAALAWRALGDRASLDKAVALLEVARLGAADAAEKDRLDRLVQTVRAEASAAASATASGPGPAPAKPDPGTITKASGGPSTLQWIAWAGGGAVAAGGLALWLTGSSKTQAANDDYQGSKISYASYVQQRKDADVFYFSGIGLTAVGVGAAVAGLFLGPKDRAVTWLPRPGGMALAVRF